MIKGENMVSLILFVSLSVSLIGFPIIIPPLKGLGIVGKNMNSETKEEITEMGGSIIAIGFIAGIIMVIVGVFDDLISIKQRIKALIPVFSALPLIAIKEGYTVMNIPFLGLFDFGIFYSLILVPLSITGAANAVNMLAGFNGLEAGMGIVAAGSLAIIAFLMGQTTSLIILMALLGALLATLYYNWYPAKILIGDAGTLCIGAAIATSVIIGNFEAAGIIIIIPYFVDLLIKAKNHFPAGIGGEYIKMENYIVPMMGH